MSAVAGSAEANRYGWVMVGVTFMLTGLSFGGLGTIAVFIKPLSAEFGWSRGEVAFGYTTIAFSSVVALLWGWLADRYGARWMAILGAFGMALSLYLMSRQAALWQLYCFYFLFGALGHNAVNGPLYSASGFWFSRNKGLALGVMSAGGAVGQAVLPFTAQALITDHGWRDAYAIMAAIYFVLSLPLALLVREPPARRGGGRATLVPSPDETPFPLPPRETVAWLSAAAVFCCLCMAVPIVHLVPLISDRGIHPQTAAGVLSVLMIAGAFGRVLGGKLADHIGALGAYMIASFGQSALVLWFPHVLDSGGLYALAVVFGLVYSGVMTSILVCVREMVPARVNARAMAIVIMFAWIGMGSGGYQGGLFFDLTGDYVWSYANAAIAGAINVAILVAFHLHIRRRRVALDGVWQTAKM